MAYAGRWLRSVSVATLVLGMSAMAYAQVYDFEDGTLQGWSDKGNTFTSLGYPVNSTLFAHNGTHSLGYPLSLTMTTIEGANSQVQGTAVRFVNPREDYSSSTQIILWLRVVGGTFASDWLWAQPYLFSSPDGGANWNYYSGGTVNGFFPGDGWVKITWDISGITPRNTVGEIGVWISAARGATGLATLYLDDFLIMGPGVPTQTVTSTGTPTLTSTRTATPTPTVTATPSGSPTGTSTRTMTATGTPSSTFTATRTVTPTPTITLTLTASATLTPYLSPTISPTVTVTLTRTDTPTAQPTPSLPAPDVISAYPNPAQDQAIFYWQEANPQSVKIEIWNLQGERVALLQPSAGQSRTTWDARDVARGIYLYRAVIVTSGGVTKTSAFKKLALLQNK